MVPGPEDTRFCNQAAANGPHSRISIMTASMANFGVQSVSLLSDERLTQARDTYRPTNVAPTGEMAFAHWSARVAAQPALVSARELSGLANDDLAALAAEFAQAPTARRAHRWVLPAGVSTTIAGTLMLGLHQLGADPASASGLAVLNGMGSLALLAGLATLCLATARAYMGVPMDKAYCLLGLYVGELTEQHPWLYKTVLLTHNPAAEAYRVRVLTERGVLRGVDYVMMEEIAMAQENMELTTTARTMRERVQRLPAK
jgi:hypothetical protein